MEKIMDFFIKISKYLLPLVLVAWCVILLAQKIDLPLADIGRHIKNGEIIIANLLNPHPSPLPEGEGGRWGVLYTNFYSYTEPNHPFVNHHWLSGVIFYLVHQLFGFKGLSVFYIAIVSLAFLLFYRIAQKRAGSAIAASLAVLVLPIITSRTEIRPEGFTYLFMAVFFWVLSKNRTDRTDGTDKTNGNKGMEGEKWDKRVFALPVLMMLWVNLHIGFIFGFLILGAFWLEALIKGGIKTDRFRHLTIIGILCLITGLINPFFIKGLLYPLNIFRQYGYMIVENQSVMFLERLGMGSGLYFGLFKFLLGLGLAALIVRFIFFVIPTTPSVIPTKVGIQNSNADSLRKNHTVLDSGYPALLMQKGRGSGMTKSPFPYHEFLLLATAGLLAVLAIRNFPVFGLLFLPITASNIKSILPEAKHRAYKILPAVIAITVLIFGGFRFWENYQNKKLNFGIGLSLGVERAAEFFKANKIKGPVFNNYDIGGYLIYNLFDSSKPSPAPPYGGASSPIQGEENMEKAMVFTDNRPEAYSIDHFQKEYIPAQQDSVKWKELDRKYNFNAVFFSLRDLTPWGQTFLISKTQDPEWAPVFADQYSIIFVKNNLENAELIKKYLLPPERFRVISN